jgi:hypothetical protein
VQEIVNMAAVAVIDAQERSPQPDLRRPLAVGPAQTIYSRL